MLAGFQSIRTYAYCAELGSSILTSAAGALLANTGAAVAVLAVFIALIGRVGGTHFMSTPNRTNPTPAVCR